MVRLATFNDNVQVVHIGHLFRNSGHKEWRIFVWFNPMQERKWTRFTHLPLLSRAKVVNSTTKQINKADRVIEFEASDLQRAKIIDYFGSLKIRCFKLNHTIRLIYLLCCTVNHLSST